MSPKWHLWLNTSNLAKIGVLKTKYRPFSIFSKYFSPYIWHLTQWIIFMYFRRQGCLRGLIVRLFFSISFSIVQGRHLYNFVPFLRGLHFYSVFLVIVKKNDNASLPFTNIELGIFGGFLLFNSSPLILNRRGATIIFLTAVISWVHYKRYFMFYSHVMFWCFLEGIKY